MKEQHTLPQARQLCIKNLFLYTEHFWVKEVTLSKLSQTYLCSLPNVFAVVCFIKQSVPLYAIMSATTVHTDMKDYII